MLFGYHKVSHTGMTREWVNQNLPSWVNFPFKPIAIPRRNNVRPTSPHPPIRGIWPLLFRLPVGSDNSSLYEKQGLTPALRAQGAECFMSNWEGTSSSLWDRGGWVRSRAAMQLFNPDSRFSCSPYVYICVCVFLWWFVVLLIESGRFIDALVVKVKTQNDSIKVFVSVPNKSFIGKSHVLLALISAVISVVLVGRRSKKNNMKSK